MTETEGPLSEMPQSELPQFEAPESEAPEPESHAAKLGEPGPSKSEPRRRDATRQTGADTVGGSDRAVE